MTSVHRRSGSRIACDVVIVGSGSGGAAAAARLAEGGLEVVLLEEGSHHASASFTRSFIDSALRLYRDFGATVIHGPPNILFQEGRCLGGSTVVNGGMAWATPERVMAEWRRDHGLHFMHPDVMGPYFEYVDRSIHVHEQPDSTMSAGELLFRDAAESLGMRVTRNRRAQDRCHGSGVCILGCPDDRKQSALITYIPRASAAGARVTPDCRADRVIVRSGRAVGIAASRLDRESGEVAERLIFEAPVVLLAGGALQTPALMQRSGLGGIGSRVGRNLRCHPNAKVVGVYDRDVRGWQGVHQGSQIHHFLGEGILLACAGLPPAAVAPGLRGFGDDHWTTMRDFHRMLVTAVLVDDSTSGRVVRLPGGLLVPFYRLDALAAQRMQRGVEHLARIHFAGGAIAVHTPFAELPILRSMDDVTRLRDLSVDARAIEVVTVHAMGTCAIGADPDRHVVRPTGESWHVPGLWIADASLLPTSVGLNPMVTIQALATYISDQVLTDRRRYLRR